MDKKELLRRAEDPKYISGIYNYCDRWCERCPLTSRCLNYAMGEESIPKEISSENQNEKFWDDVSRSLDMALRLLADLAEEQGIDLDAIDIEEDPAPPNKVHILSQMSKNYFKTVDAWVGEHRALVEAAFEQDNPTHLQLVQPEPENVRMALREALEVVMYYKYFISAKLDRAIRGKDEDTFDFEDRPKDSDGSAKIALIAMDRSISAWGALVKELPEHRGVLLEMAGRLKQLRDITEKEFPGARSFVRPGFDQNSS